MNLQELQVLLTVRQFPNEEKSFIALVSGAKYAAPDFDRNVAGYVLTNLERSGLVKSTRLGVQLTSSGYAVLKKGSETLNALRQSIDSSLYGSL